MKREELRNSYIEASQNFRNIAKKEDKKLLVLSLLRFLCFAGGIIITVIFFIEHLSGLAIASAFITVILFLFLLRLYSDHSDKKEIAGNLSSINIKEAGVLNGDLSGFDSGRDYTDFSHDFSFDVDLFGDNSLFQYLNRTVTGYGRDVLAGWLSDPFSLSSDLMRRQEIIRELAIKREWRQKFMASGMKVPFGKENIMNFTYWLSEKQYIEASGTRKILIYVLPVIACISVIMLIAGLIHYSVFVMLLLLNLAYVSAGLKTTNRIHNAVSGRYGYLFSIKSLLNVIAEESFRSEYLKAIRNQIASDEVSASTSVKKLGRIIQSFDSRLNLLVGFSLNALLLWDYHCIRRLEKWKSDYKDKFPVWLEILAEIDAYSGLGNFAYNNPDFSYPVMSKDGKVFSATGLGHPLISEDKRVCNDFELSDRGNICIITGANMAGKSTFLRTVAVNYILAMAGAPVCAGRLEFSPVKLFTSMRTTDSLAGNESYFYAELKRLKTLKSKITGNEPVFFILDEILKGTNSADKSLGSKLFIKKLIPSFGTGLIATHDISLGDLEYEFPDRIFNVCFEIVIDGETIMFDYKLQEGITKKMNAALLMRQMGILD
ncbi:MAG TPA: hypothetical protein VHO46_00815 [Bacteroidales bacterium]|nr:hypothetical protein [Bacteroidales bacterium]